MLGYLERNCWAALSAASALTRGVRMPTMSTSGRYWRMAVRVSGWLSTRATISMPRAPLSRQPRPSRVRKLSLAIGRHDIRRAAGNGYEIAVAPDRALISPFSHLADPGESPDDPR